MASVCADPNFGGVKRVVVFVGVNNDAASHLDVLGCSGGVALHEFGFAIELHPGDGAITGFYGEGMVGNRGYRSHDVIHAAMGKGQGAWEQSAEQSEN